jgi:acyl-CoA thioester hydrolase
MEYEFEISTRYSDTAQDKIIHHSSYIVYLEEARISYLKELGIFINDLESKKIFCPVVELCINYLKPLFSGEKIKILLKAESLGKVRFKFDYIIKKNNESIATAESTHCFVNEAFKPIGLIEPFKTLLLRFKK